MQYSAIVKELDKKKKKKGYFTELFQCPTGGKYLTGKELTIHRIPKPQKEEGNDLTALLFLWCHFIPHISVDALLGAGS